MGIKSKVYTFLNRIVTIVENKSKGIYVYDSDNLLPQKLIRQISESGTATACIEAINQYVYADGLVDETLGKTLANDTQTFNQLIGDLVPSTSMFSGVAIHITRDGSGKVIKTKGLPYENIRVADNGNYIYNPTYSLDTKFDIKKDVEYPKYKGAKIDSKQLAEIVSFKNDEGKILGEILYYFKKKPGQYIYSIPAYYSAISDIDADAENSKLELETTNNSFLPSGFLTFVGDIDDKTEDENGKTDWDYTSDTCAAFTGNVKDGKGESGRHKLAVFTAPTKEELPVYQSINTDGVFNAIDLSSRRVSEKVARVFGVPNFLIGLGGAVGFSTNIISDNIALFNNRVTPYKTLIQEALNLCYPGYDFTLTVMNPVKYIAPEIYAKLTDSELRDLGGYKTEETKTQSSISLAQTLGVGSTTSLFEVIKDPLLSREVKINSLVYVFNLPLETAQKLVADVIPPINN